MIAGFSRVEITPLPREHPEMMGFGAFLGRTALEVLQPIHVRASYLEDGGKALVLSFDLCGLSEKPGRGHTEGGRRGGGPERGAGGRYVHAHSLRAVCDADHWLGRVRRSDSGEAAAAGGPGGRGGAGSGCGGRR